MSNPDFISLYFPAIGELTEAEIKDARRRAEIFVKQFDPEVDTRPNTPFGDLHLNNLARFLASMEIAHGRFMSDLDLEQVANGVIYNCDFVSKYLKNFAVYEQETLGSSGVIRLTFCADEACVIDRRTRYQFGSDTFELRLPHEGPLEVLPVGSTPPTATNARVLTQVDEDKYAIDVAVVGVMNTLVVAGQDGTTDLSPTNLAGISALYDFEFGTPPSSLSSLAAKARETHYSSSLSTVGGTRNYLKREFPDLKVVSPVITGDIEMIRDISNPLGVGAGYLDVHVQSAGHSGEDQQYIKLRYYDTQDAVAVQRYIGALDLVGIPQQIISITSASSPDVFLGLGTSALEIFSESTDPANAPLAQAAYSPQERLWIAVDMPRTDTGVDRLVNDIDLDTGFEYHRFLVRYKTDPMVSVVKDDVESRTVKPVGVNVFVRGMVPIVISDFLITYTRSPGVTMKLDAAREEIYNYFKGLGYPTLYSDSKIVDAMYYAGAEDVVSVRPTAYVQWTVADWIVKNPGVVSPEEDLTTVLSGSVKPPRITIASTNSLVPSYQDENIGLSSQTYVSAGPRNVGYILDKNNIRFSEVVRL
jgi:hypothetical protein